jgi:hypothetical protein
MHGVREPRLQRCDPYPEKCGAEHKTRGAEAIKLCWTSSPARGSREETKADGMGPLEQNPGGGRLQIGVQTHTLSSLRTRNASMHETGSSR